MANDVIQFTIKGIDASKSAFSSASKSIQSVGKASLKMGKYAAGAATAITGFTTVIANGIDKQAKFAQRIGVNVEELSKLQFAADQAGISTEQFNMATQRMTRRVAEAAKGTGEAKGALRELGIDAKAFANLGVEDQMAKLSDAMGDVEGSSDKLRLAFKLFDSEGTSMLQMLKGGSEAMRAAAADAEFLGLVISKQGAANAEHFKDSLGRATGAIKGVSMAIANELMPVMSGMANNFANSLASNREAIVAWTKQAITGFFTAIEVIKQFGAGVRAIFTDPTAFSNFLENMKSVLTNVGVIAIAIGKAIVVGIGEGLQLVGLLALSAGDALIHNLKAAVMGGEMMDITDHIGSVMVQGFDDANEKIKAVFNETTGVALEASAQIGESYASAFNIDLEGAQQSAEAAIANLQEFGTVAAETMQENMAQTSEMMLALQDESLVFLEGLNESYSEFASNFFESMNTGIDNLSNGMAQAIAQGQSMGEVFKKVAKDMLTQMLASLIKLGIQRLILAGITNTANASEASAGASKAVGLAGANMFASWAGAPWPISIGAPAAAAGAVAGASAAFSAGAAAGQGVAGAIAGARADGGPVTGGRTFLVGERGPELFTPGTNGNITSNEDLGALGGSGGVIIENVEININVPEGDTFGEMSTEEMASMIGDATIQALNNLDRVGIVPNFVERGRV